MDAHAVIGVGTDATDAEIRVAYLRLKRGLQTLTQRATDDHQRQEAIREMARLNVAFQMLTDPAVRLHHLAPPPTLAERPPADDVVATGTTVAAAANPPPAAAEPPLWTAASEPPKPTREG